MYKKKLMSQDEVWDMVYPYTNRILGVLPVESDLESYNPLDSLHRYFFPILKLNFFKMAYVHGGRKGEVLYRSVA